MKNLLIMHCFLAVLIFFMNMPKVSAENELETAEIRLVCAICSMGAYSDDESYLMRSMLNERGWTIEKITQKNNRAYARAYLVSKNNIKVLAIAGTENLKDVEVNFRVGRVHLNDNFTLNPYEKNIRDKIFVHRGFRDYADLVLSDGLAERLKNSVENNPNEIIYLTGHSLGGSVATIVAIRLADSGFSTKNLKVITFGAPAVGSRELAKNYSDKIELTRVVMRGDVVKKSLRALGYVQFGKTLEYRQNSSSEHMEHKMAVYLDCTIRDYLSSGGTLRYETQNKIATPIYVAPIHLVKGDFHSDDEKIILNALDDSLRNNFSNLTFAPVQSVKINEKKILDEDFDEFVAASKNFGCKYVLIRILRAKKIRDAQSGEKFVTLEEIILDTNGVPLSMQTSGESTAELTIFEAAIAVQENLKDNIRNFLANN
ncbi:MAG: lipase family protein [Selenomonadaceae bacterium]|nr:lipase family protein [Selenomonadaceae bacterium]